ncbi:dehydrodolichyl diphosphate synthase 6-like [Euphorbia lathyris]|uniref:dehydrodolichyl diphosphate synthase 6-like n=1 Tax=Euphorbia lathyris TaxID=212925 RepID=UPI0033132B18
MGVHGSGRLSELYQSLCSCIRICIFRVLSMGSIPDHIAFIMDGNRRYAKKNNFKEGAGHRAGFSSLISLLKCCYELGVKYVTVYAFSIDNFKRCPDEVKELMDLMLEKMEELLQEESVVHQYGIRVYFIGNLKLLSESVRIAAEKVMKATAHNTKCTLLICIAYTSRDEIVNAVRESCTSKQAEIQSSNFYKANSVCAEEVKEGKKRDCVTKHGLHESPKNDADVECGKNMNGVITTAVQRLYEESEKDSIIKAVDIEKHMYMSVAPEPDILIRSSGETRLSNFLLWQSSNCVLYSPNALWPEIGLWHLVWAVLNFQHNHPYLEKSRKQF